MRDVKRIALLLGQDLGYCRDNLRGIQAYSVTRNNWIFRDAAPEPENLDALREWKPHGFIAHLFRRDLAETLQRMKQPVVNTTSTLADCKIPLVEVDHWAVGRMAAEYFLDRGYQSFGYYGSSWTHFSKAREESFRAALEEKGHTVSSCHALYLPRPTAEVSWAKTEKRVQKWLASFEKPVAIFCCNDVPARDLTEICLQLDLRVPEEVAILGVDNDEFECHLARPALSSVQIPGEQVGYEAAKLLDAMMSNRKLRIQPLFLPPIRVVTRQSTDALAVDDEELRRALSFIRENIGQEINVDSVSRGTHLGRRTLERKMSRLLGRTVHQEIKRMRLELAKGILTSSKVGMHTVAHRCGFSSARRFAVVFKQSTGSTPTEFRAASHRSQGS
ncbi:MAG: DNA-binding transcriptional regulator [Pirellulales bacterium]|nr:DNA-binding transcriptional regulator [Pirellulales bacterium]